MIFPDIFNFIQFSPETEGNPAHVDGNIRTKQIEEPASDVLLEILPRKYGDLYDNMRLMERTVQIFMYCLGVRGSLRMGPTAFRTFTR